ncbi:hypothetical protein [Methanococcus sp. CF]
MSFFNFDKKYKKEVSKGRAFALELTPEKIGITTKDFQRIMLLGLYEKLNENPQRKFYNGYWRGFLDLNLDVADLNAKELIKKGILTAESINESEYYVHITKKGTIYAKLLNIWVFFIDKLDEFLVFLALLCLDRIISQFIQNWTFKIYILGFLVLIALRYFKNK